MCGRSDAPLLHPAVRAWCRLVSFSVWSYLAFVVAAWGTLAFASDRWWPVTLLMFAPRWLWAAPLGVLVPAVELKHPRLIVPLVLAAAIAIGPLSGLCLPWRAPFEPAASGMKLRVLSFNSDFTRLDPAQFRALLAEAKPDVVALQEAYRQQMPNLFDPRDWHVHSAGELYLASRFPIRKVELPDPDTFRPGAGRVARYELETPAGLVHCFNLHLATPRAGLTAVVNSYWKGGDTLQANSDLRRRQSQAIRREASTLAGPVLLVGDFNTPVESTIYRECWSPYANAFSVAGTGWGNTHLTRRTGVRIDHILASGDWRVERCWVGPNVGSAHRPVIADLVWQSPVALTADAASPQAPARQ